MTAEQCKATSKSSGKRCKRKAIPGGTVCRYHGGAAPQVQGKAKTRIAVGKVRELMEKLGVKDEDPLIGLLREVSRSAVAVEILGNLVGELDAGTEIFGENHLGDHTQHVLFKMWSEERDRHARYCKMALDAGVAERQVQVAEEQGAMMAQVIAAVFDDPGLGLSQTQRRTGKKIAARHLKALPTAG